MYKIGLEIKEDWPAFLKEMGAFIRAQTSAVAVPLVPEIKLYLATEIDPLWRATEDVFQSKNIPAPFWCVAWAGGQGLARYILDNPEYVRGKRVFDFATGSGLVALAAKKAGAAHVVANDIDPAAIAAATCNANENNLDITVLHQNMLGKPMRDIDLILAGDFCYEWPMAGQAVDWLRVCVQEGIDVIFADPGRPHAPRLGIEEMAQITVPTTLDVEDSTQKNVKIMRLFGDED